MAAFAKSIDPHHLVRWTIVTNAVGLQLFSNILHTAFTLSGGSLSDQHFSHCAYQHQCLPVSSDVMNQ